MTKYHQARREKRSESIRLQPSEETYQQAVRIENWKSATETREALSKRRCNRQSQLVNLLYVDREAFGPVPWAFGVVLTEPVLRIRVITLK